SRPDTFALSGRYAVDARLVRTATLVDGRAMRCPVCATEIEASRVNCPRCYAELHPAASTREQDPRPALSDGSADRLAGRAAMSYRWLARFVDAVVCLVILGLAVGVATLIADFRGGAGLTSVVRHLSWAHLGLALIVIAVYRVAAESLTGQTVG